ncbi:MAG TPA: alpha/beta fold hydrolase [Pseudonocardiaceae bacterium]|nr:alpha/beta fold hydrolase [Pseudonocardiaceae bacterium]
MDCSYYELGDLPLLRGGALTGATIAYTTRGTLNSDRTNAVLCPSFFGGDHTGYDWLVGAGRPLDPERHFVIVASLFGNGRSSSPSNHPAGRNFPDIMVQDNVAAQYRLVTEGLGVRELALVTGWSMGAAHAYQWAVSHPGFVRRIAPICGSAVTSEHNRVFLSALRAALRAEGDSGQRTAGRVFASLAASHRFWADRAYAELGFSSREEYLVGFWEAFFTTGRQVEDLLTMLWTWEHADVGSTPGTAGDAGSALAAVRAKAVLLPGERDLCFAAADEAASARLMPDATLRVIPGIWGHLAGAGMSAPDRDFVSAALGLLLASPNAVSTAAS